MFRFWFETNTEWMGLNEKQLVKFKEKKMVKDIERISCKMSEFLKLLWINVSICALFRKMFVITKASSEQWKKIEKKIEKKKWKKAQIHCEMRSCQQ